jgi:agmatine deiminase
MTFRMPAEWEPHERTLIGWPCRLSSWGGTLAQGRAEFAAVANAIAAFEPVTMVCASEADAAGARPVLASNVEIAVHPMDGSWLRDNGPIFVTDGRTRRARHFRFNGWGERHAQRDRDARLGATLARSLGDPVDFVDVVLEGGAVSVDGAGTMVAPEGCIMHANRNWYLTRDEAEARLKEALGLSRLIWLPHGLAEDLIRDPDRMYYGTDGHIDLFFSFIAKNRALILAVPENDPNAAHLAQSRNILEAAGMEVVEFPYMSSFEASGRHFIAPYLNFYICNGAVIVPVAGSDRDMDEEALTAISREFPSRQIIGIEVRASPMQGGAIHCMTQQVPKKEFGFFS